VTKPIGFEVEVAIVRLKRYKPQGIDRIPTEIIKVGGRTIPSEIHKLINYLSKKGGIA
jgi:hypothetical protein